MTASELASRPVLDIWADDFLRRGVLSLRPKGRPAGAETFGTRCRSSGSVTLCHVLAVHMSRTVFSLTPNDLETDTAVYDFPFFEDVDDFIL